MQYIKQYLSVEAQACSLIKQGMVADEQELIAGLKQIGYYRLSAYWHPFRIKGPCSQKSENKFHSSVHFSLIWSYYRFDRNLRLLLLDAVERIEVALRCQLVELHMQKQNATPFDYAEELYFPKWKGYISKLEVMKNPKLSRKTARDDFVEHFFNKYGNCHEYLPLWMAVNLADFGFISFFYEHSSKHIRQQIAKEWELKQDILCSWLKALNTLRNTCAHHNRSWNRVWRITPKFPSFADQPEWYETYFSKAHKWIRPKNVSSLASDSIVHQASSTGSLLYICHYLLSRIAPQSRWKFRVEKLFDEFIPLGIEIKSMGLSPHWKMHPLWK